MILPVAEVQVVETHRLIPSKYSDGGTVLSKLTVLSRLTEDEADLSNLMELDGATNDRLLGEEGLLPGIGVHELLYGVRYASIVNAAFTHASPAGGRFNNSERGAWYCGLQRETSVAEVAFHKLMQLEEVDWKQEEVSTCDDYLADFTAEMHDLRARRPQYRRYLKAAPIPDCYADSQQLAAGLLAGQSNGIVYPSVRHRPSVRHKGGTCIVCFRPTLVYHVRQGARLEFRLLAGREFEDSQVREIRSRARRQAEL